MLDSSQDLLNILLGVSVLAVAFCFSWLLYEMIQSIRGFNQVIKKIQKITDSVHDGIKSLKTQSSHAAAYIGLAVKAGQEILHQVQKRRAHKGKSKSSKD